MIDNIVEAKLSEHSSDLLYTIDKLRKDIKNEREEEIIKKEILKEGIRK